MLIYIHGFNSSPASFKARLLKERLEALGRGADFIAPALPHSPAAAAERLDTLLAQHAGAALVGSSLGGYYATYLAERHGLRAALLNPAVRPYELLRDCLGTQQNLYTRERYEFTARHLDELRALEMPAITPSRYLLVVATGDETLDYRAAVARYEGCQRVLIEGGDHGLSEFGVYVDAVLEFCGIAPSA